MTKERRMTLESLYPYINLKGIFINSWGLNKRNGPKDEIVQKFTGIFNYLKQYLLETGIKGIAYYDYFTVRIEDNSLIFPGKDVKWTFPRIQNKCIADSAKETGTIALQVVTLGKKISEIMDLMEKDEQFSLLFYLHGFSVWLTEALAERHHGMIHDEWKDKNRKERYSFGYTLCPDLSYQQDLFKLLDLNTSSEVELTENFMMVPEQSTSAVIFH
ncbi:MAG: vitamin B12 dependent-methionine synthase activation domain-containing protein [Candidatus Margulisbacteria bacterium]|nr:vitamin B12 dependent-methionine synthase activation domain-containing protein [Candidatus Margulisiibacteriota bacterium]